MDGRGPARSGRGAGAAGRSAWRPDAQVFRERGLDETSLDSALILALRGAGGGDVADLAVWRERMFLEARRRLFPNRFPAGDAASGQVAQLFLPLALAVVEEQWRRGGDGIAQLLPFRALGDEETRAWPSAAEYALLLGHLEGEGFIACLAMAQQWRGLTVFDHVLGVTGLALFLGRQLSRSVAIDLPLLHGAAIGHDIGKFGCIGDEERRIPRLHYYYTHLYYAQRNLPGLGHIATNHSCWDLELVRLPVETQLLIYADFRAKDALLADGRRRMEIIPLRESYQAILDKLENVDADKVERYRRVYAKLRDLEDWALALGVALDPPGIPSSDVPPPVLPAKLDVVAVMSGRERADAVALATGEGVRTVGRLLTTAHTIGVMERLRDLPALVALLEEARSFEGWRDLRTYLGVLGEFAPALSMEQRELAGDFFFALLAHRDDDIRYHAANRIGDLLALGEESWRKDLPAGVLPERGGWVFEQIDRVIALLDTAGDGPELDMSPTEQVCYGVPLILRRLVRRAGTEARAALVDHILARLEARAADRRPLVGLYVCESLEVLLSFFAGAQRQRAAALAAAFAAQATDNVRLMARRVLLALAEHPERDGEVLAAIAAVLAAAETDGRSEVTVAETYLALRLARLTDAPERVAACAERLANRRSARREVMLRNLKTQVGWVVKKVNCDYLVDTALERTRSGQDPDAHFANEVAFHLANLLKVSRVEGTRFHAGRSILRLLPVLSDTQRNDLAIELLRSLQLDVEAVTRYIPRFLGPLVASLPEQEFHEVLADIGEHVRSGSEPLQRLLVQTVGWIFEAAPASLLTPPVLRRLAGMLLGALADTRASTAHEGYAQLAMVFERLSAHARQRPKLVRLLRLVTKKVLSLVSHASGDRSRYFLIAQALTHLDRALTLAGPAVRFPRRPSVGLLPGTHDPFTAAHAEIVAAVAPHVDEVLVQVDDYSWRKHAQPRGVRQELAWMALAPLPDAFLAPFDPPVNLMDRRGVAALRRRLGGRRLSVIVGTDVLENASAYRSPNGHLWRVPHVVVRRDALSTGAWRDRLPWFSAGVEVVSLPAGVRAVSSTSVRSALDRRDDAAMYCDPLVARTLTERQLYRTYPQRKVAVTSPAVRLVVAPGGAPIPGGLVVLGALEPGTIPSRWRGKRHELCVLEQEGEARAAASWREIGAAELPVLLPAIDFTATDVPLLGRGAIVDAVAAYPGDRGEQAGETLLDLLFARWLDAGFSFVVVPAPATGAVALARLLAGRGGTTAGRPGLPALHVLLLAAPVVVVHDLEHVLQPAYAADAEVAAVVRANRRDLASFLSGRLPGAAIVTVNETTLRQELAERAAARVRAGGGAGKWVVLGLGAQFSRDLVGDSPTLAVALERFLTWEGYDGGFGPPAGAPNLEMQLHTARELGREALLLVPFLDDSTPVLLVAEACRTAGLALREVMIGVTDAVVHARLHHDGIEHHCTCVVPGWRGVLRESAVVPYVGGWTIAGREPLPISSLVPSLNDCLPYHEPHMFGFDRGAALDFSRLVLAQARALTVGLEEAFRRAEGRFLSLHDLGAVVRVPRCPPLPRGFVPARERPCSELLAEDAHALARLHPETHEAHRAMWRGM